VRMSSPFVAVVARCGKMKLQGRRVAWFDVCEVGPLTGRSTWVLVH